MPNHTIIATNLTFYAIKRRITQLFAQLGLSLGLMLIFLQAQITGTLNESEQAVPLITNMVQLMQPFVEVVSEVVTSFFNFGML